MRKFFSFFYYHILLNRLTIGLSKNLHKHCIRILAYHSVGANDNPFLKGIGDVSVRTFERQIKYLKKNYNIISLGELQNCILNNRKILDKAVLITFDDGYRNVYENAVPILVRYKCPACIFLIGMTINNDKIMWRNKLFYILNTGKSDLLKDRIESHFCYKNNGFLSEPNIYFWTKRNFSMDVVRVIDNVFRHIITADEHQIAKEVQLYISISDIKNIDKSLITFGNHSFNHYPFSKLTKREQENEIISCGKIIEDINPGVSTFSIAFGEDEYMNNETIMVLKSLGYEIIFKGESKICSARDLKNSELYIFPRISVPNNLSHFKAKIEGVDWTSIKNHSKLFSST